MIKTVVGHTKSSITRDEMFANTQRRLASVCQFVPDDLKWILPPLKWPVHDAPLPPAQVPLSTRSLGMARARIAWVYSSPYGRVRRRRTTQTPLARRLEHDDDYLEKRKKDGRIQCTRVCCRWSNRSSTTCPCRSRKLFKISFIARGSDDNPSCVFPLLTDHSPWLYP